MAFYVPVLKLMALSLMLSPQLYAQVQPPCGPSIAPAPSPRYKTVEPDRDSLPDFPNRRFKVPEEQRLKYRLNVDDGVLVDADGNPARIRIEGQQGLTIFVMDGFGSIYFTNFPMHHDSLTGEAVAAAGELKYSKTEASMKLVVVDKSGHYHPSPSLTRQFLVELELRGYDLDNVIVESVRPQTKGTYSAREFLALHP